MRNTWGNRAISILLLILLAGWLLVLDGWFFEGKYMYNASKSWALGIRDNAVTKMRLQKENDDLKKQLQKERP